ncbi:MAG: flagellar type III secretion system pore protein FliP [bacterium]|nr:flagellar type III secretion system pore protein FliP [bacterium]
MRKLRSKLILVFLVTLFFGAQEAFSQDASALSSATTQPNSLPSPGRVIDIVDKATGPDAEGNTSDWSAPVRLAVVFALLAILPSMLVMMTSFTRIIIVLSFLRRALTTQNIPPTVALLGLAMFLMLFTMAPTFAQMNDEALQPYLDDEITFAVGAERAYNALAGFMLRQTREADIEFMVEMSGSPAPATQADIPAYVLIPSFAISEFRKAFEMGCLIFIPFLVVDLVTSGILLSAGMMMLPPVMISLPFKIILFVLVDGWQLTVRTLVTSFR